MKKQQSKQEDLDLRHDTMEFAANGDEEIEKEDVLDLGEQNITAEELDFLDDEDPQAQEAAMNAVEHDLPSDGEYINVDEDWTDDFADDIAEDEEDEEQE